MGLHFFVLREREVVGGGGMWQKLSMRVGMCKLEVFRVEASDWFGNFYHAWVFKMYVATELPQINSLSFLRRSPLRDEQRNYNNTILFIEELLSKLDKNKISILIAHVPLGLTNKKQVVPVMKVRCLWETVT